MKSEWQESFRSHMTRTTFNLTLTRAMMEMLCATSDDVRWDRWRYGGPLYPDNFLATEHALIRRGLLRRKLRIAKSKEEFPTPWELTPAGEALIALMKVGGIFIEAEEAREKLMKQKGHRN